MVVQIVALEKADRPRGQDFSLAEIQAMQRAVVRLFGHWDITDAEAATLLGDISERTYQRWKGGAYGRVSVDLAARLSNLIAIHKALRLLYVEADRAYRWIKSSNRAFDGARPLDIMLRGQLTDLMRVRRYLDSYRSPW